MTRYGASSRHHAYDFDSDSDTGRNYSPPRSNGRPLRGLDSAHRGPMPSQGGADAHSYHSSDDDGDSESCDHHHHHHRGQSGGAHSADPFYGSDEDSDFDAGCSYHHGHGHGRAGAGGSSRDGPRIVSGAHGTAARSGSHAYFCGNILSSDDDDSGCEHHATGSRTGHLRPEARFDTDSSDDDEIDLAHHMSYGAYGPGGRRSTTAAAPVPPPRRGRAPTRRDGGGSDDGAELDRYMASSRRGRGQVARGGMMAPPLAAPRHGRARGDRRGRS